jgi:small subunit ribosomal protein S17
MEKNNRRVLTGTVVSDKMDKTITVLVETYKNHCLYHKIVKSSKKSKAHNENGVASITDTVKLMETRPLSATKYLRLVEVVKKASISE